MLANGDGEPVWQRTYRMWEDCNDCYFTSVRELDGDVIVTGNGRAPDRVRLAWTMRINMEAGEPVWADTTRFGNVIYAFPTSIVSAPNGDFLIGGRAYDGANGIYRPLLLRIGSNGIVRWTRTFNLEGYNRVNGNTLYRIQDIGFLYCGTIIMEGNPRRGFISRLDQNGQILWQRIFHFDQDNRFHPASNGLESVVIGLDRGIYCAGTVNNRAFGRGQDGIIVRLEPEIDGALIVQREPVDSLLDVLKGDSIQFLLRARNQRGLDISYRWSYLDTIRSIDTTVTIRFDTLGNHSVLCRLDVEDWIQEVEWRVNVASLFITSHSPDTLSLTLQRNSEIDFALDSIAYIGDMENLRYEWMIYDSTAVRWEEVGGDDRI
ncbi:MAG: hypothetical protein FJY67_06280, partial [Calditrichaeota bacterium]|nr:hypothetical protein [Calditrichota bacterium]